MAYMYVLKFSQLYIYFHVNHVRKIQKKSETDVGRFAWMAARVFPDEK